jgi:hypothetical protein
MRVLLALITVGVTIYTFVDCLHSTDEEVRNLPRPLWLLVTMVPLVGGLTWLILGRPSATAPTKPSPSPHPPAPDDDPEFLRSLDRSLRERRRQAAEEARHRAEENRHRAEENRRQAEREKGTGKPGNGTAPSAGTDGDQAPT